MTSSLYSASDPFDWSQVRKTADESVASSATLQNDDELFFTAVSGAMYEIEVVLIYGSPAGAGTPDLKIGFGEDASNARGSMQPLSFTTSTDAAGGATSAPAATNNGTALATLGTAATDRVAKIVGTHTGAGGVFRLLWAQGTSGANASIVRAGSVLRYRRVV